MAAFSACVPQRRCGVNRRGSTAWHELLRTDATARTERRCWKCRVAALLHTNANACTCSGFCWRLGRSSQRPEHPPKGKSLSPSGLSTPLILPALAQSWARASQWPVRSPHPTPSCSRRRRAPGLPLKSPCSQCGPKSWNQGSLGRRSRAGAAGSGAADHAAAPRTPPLSRLLQSRRRLSPSRPIHRGEGTCKKHSREC